MQPFRFRAGAAIAVAALACSAGCGSESTAQGPPAMPPTPVTLVELQPAPVEDLSEYVATVQSLRSTTLHAQQEGRIVAIHVRSGDRVQAGARIMEVDAGRQHAALAREEADLAAREATAELARQERRRMRDLFEAGIGSKQAADQAEAALKTAESNLDALRARINEERVRLAYFTITAPVDGTVGDVPVRVGTYVTTQTPLTTIDQTATLELHVPVPVERAPALRPGLVVHVATDDGAPPADVTIDFVSPRVEEASQTVLAKASLANTGQRFRPNQSVRVQVVWRTYEAVRVPVVAVVRVSGQHFAYVAEEQNGALVARQRAVRLGRIVGDDYIVEDGLSANDRLVSSGVQRLADGAPIAPVS
jgi:RND family efflux transporter MFP subunit